MAWSVPWNLLGLIVSGDVGAFTIYTDKHGRKTVFPKSPPEKPPSVDQIAQRSRFATAQAAWSALTDQEKADLEAACRKLSIPLTGQNLYIKVALTARQSAADTVASQSNIALPPIPFVA
ncbi:MAG: hypothetical protein IH899_14285 [Planctomycetes bacterium]|nr:hypothetical protein [Planctomycetota bacterium]